MSRNISKIGLIVILVLALGGSGFLGWRYYELNQAHESLNAQYERLQKKARLLQKNYSEQKSRNVWLKKTKRNLEARKAELASQVLDLQEKVEALEADSRSTITALKRQLQARVGECNSKLSSLAEKYRQTASELEGVSADLEDKKKELKRLRADIDSLESELAAARETIVRYGKENTELVKIAQELMDKYRNKDVSEVLAHKEPLIQLKKVEIEHMLQDYRNRIEEHTVEK